VLGLLEVHIDGSGEASARFVNSARPQVQVGTQAVVDPATAGIGFAQQAVSFIDDQTVTPRRRYVTTTFGLTNTGAGSYSNLTLWATNVPGNLGGTSITSMKKADGTDVASAATVARTFEPGQGVRGTGAGVALNPDLADLQLFTAGEAISTGIQAASVYPGESATVLQYGYVARNLTGGRAVGPGASGACSSSVCRGQVTLAFSFPWAGTVRAAQPYAFSLYFYVTNETTARVSQSFSEQNTAGNKAFFDRAETLSGVVGSTVQAATLEGTNLSVANNVRVCPWRVATSPDLYLGPTTCSTPPAGPTVATVSMTGLPAAIPDASGGVPGTLTMTFTVSGIGVVRDLNLSLNITHTYRRDLVVTIRSPRGETTTLVTSVGGGADNFNVTFDDEATNDVAVVCAQIAACTGRAKPQGPLSVFDNLLVNLNGTWALTIQDVASGDVGTLNSAALTFTY